ncbi:11271_t:CDS:2 [Ambispora gerdemannii]|uniref:11271_t:CDS:1 n=1 Tax=Ambispora gerdemannii TaxID=144530 RepID=A0A9N8YIB9_9GLOM|nr:11271_t:CDS:2 [Ambispora gerdemannii]
MSRRSTTLSHLSSLVLQGEEHLPILQGNGRELYYYSVILWTLKVNAEGGYTITHQLTPKGNYNDIYSSEKKSMTITQNFLSKHEVSLVDLGVQEFTVIPPAIPYLKSLRRLSISYNKLSSLPSTLFQLNGLQILHIHSNQLRSLPPQIGLLTALRELDVHSNKIKSIPPQIAKCTECNWLNLEKNRIAYLPAEIYQLKKLKQLRVDGNPFALIAHKKINDESQRKDGQSSTSCDGGGIKKDNALQNAENCIFNFLPIDILQRIVPPHDYPPTVCSRCHTPLFHDGVCDYYYYGDQMIPVKHTLCSYDVFNFATCYRYVFI